MNRNYFLKEALKEAKKALELGEVPVGCVVVKDNRIIAKAHNLVETKRDPSAHAEILALKRASEVLNSKFLEGCEVYVTLEPCIMCAYALVLFRVSKVIFGAVDEKHGGVMSLYNILDDERLNHRIKWIYEPCEECSEILKSFFKNLRREK